MALPSRLGRAGWRLSRGLLQWTTPETGVVAGTPPPRTAEKGAGGVDTVAADEVTGRPWAALLPPAAPAVSWRAAVPSTPSARRWQACVSGARRRSDACRYLVLCVRHAPRPRDVAKRRLSLPVSRHAACASPASCGRRDCGVLLAVAGHYRRPCPSPAANASRRRATERRRRAGRRGRPTC